MKIELYKNNIKYIGDNFKTHFSYGFKVPKKLKLEHKILDKNMLDKEILEQWKPQESTLGELVWALENYEAILKNGNANIFYIRDKDLRLWAVSAGWGSVHGGWSVYAISVGYPGPWSAGSQVVSRKFSSSVLGPLDSGDLESRIKELEDKVAKLLKVINLT